MVDRDTVAFLGRAFGDFSAAVTTLVAGIGDRLGLFKALVADGPATAAELAGRTKLDVRYTAEWAAAMAAAGYLEHDPSTDAFALPAVHAAVLADETSPYFLGGGWQNLLGLVDVLDEVTEAFRTGAGVPYSAYPADVFEGMARMTGTAHDNVLVPVWLPTVPDIEARLRDGCRVADIGCGQGRALIAMAKAYPASTFTGYDAYPPQVEGAAERAAAEGVADRVRFAVLDATKALPETYDVICAFDVLHDSRDPLGLLTSMRASLTDGGVALVLEPKAGATIEENAGPVGSLLYGTSLLYCLSVSLGVGGPGLGTCGTPEPVVRDLCARAGFATVDEAPIENFINRLWVARATED